MSHARCAGLPLLSLLLRQTRGRNRVAGAGAGHPRSYLIRTAHQWHPD